MPVFQVVAGNRKYTSKEMEFLTGLPVMPPASEQFYGHAYIYTGTTDPDFGLGDLYFCDREGEEGAYTYVWKEITIGESVLKALALKLDKSKVVNNLTTTGEGYALDARQGKALKDTLDTKFPTASVVNNLTTTGAGYALDARVANQLPILGTGSLTDVNLNTVVRAGFYRLYTGATSGPTQFSADYGLLIVAAVPNTTTLAQILVGYDGNGAASGRMATRTCYLTNNVWSAWREFTSGPAHIQTGTVTASVDASSTVSVPVTFPVAFPTGTAVRCWCQVVTSDPVNRSAAPTAMTTATATISIKNNITSGGSLSVWWLAVGQ